MRVLLKWLSLCALIIKGQQSEAEVVINIYGKFISRFLCLAIVGSRILIVVRAGEATELCRAGIMSLGHSRCLVDQISNQFHPQQLHLPPCHPLMFHKPFSMINPILKRLSSRNSLCCLITFNHKEQFETSLLDSASNTNPPWTHIPTLKICIFSSRFNHFSSSHFFTLIKILLLIKNINLVKAS
jgi:hypothetical protein